MKKKFYHPKTKQVMPNLSRMEELILKRLHGALTQEEDNELQAFAQASEVNRQLIDQMKPTAFHKRQEAPAAIDLDRLDRLTKQKIGDIPGILDWVPATSKERNLLPYFIKIAASILLILGAAWWFFHGSQTGETALLHVVEGTLRWPSGSIALGEMDEGKAYDAGAILIARMGNQFFIIPGRDSVSDTTVNLSYNFTDDGKEEIQVFFGDTTRIQLSPNSSIDFAAYPSSRPIKEKYLAFHGEALFDIGHHNSVPTVISTSRQTIMVLGTFFKVRDYKSEDTGAVFCYTGKVKVLVNDANSAAKIVYASQRITVDPRHELSVSTGDFPQAQWSSEELFFDFSNMDLDSAMNQIAQWYGKSSVEYRGNVDKKTSGMVYTGKLSRHLKLQQLLSILERDDLHFAIRDHAILVTGSTDRPDHSH
jgi:hypothetical protein